jgi:hypothetical protein
LSLFNLIIADLLLTCRRLSALWRRLERAGHGGDGGADLLLMFLALLLDLVGAEFGEGGVELDLAVARDVDAVLVVAVLTPVLAAGSFTLAATAAGATGNGDGHTGESKEEEERIHGCDG